MEFIGKVLQTGLPFGEFENFDMIQQRISTLKVYARVKSGMQECHE